MDIYEFPYSWRFTDEKFALFSEKELSEFTILPDIRTNFLWNRIIHTPVFYESDYIQQIVNRSIPVFISDCGWGDRQQEASTRKKLADFLCDCGSSVMLFYNKDDALELSVNLFLDRWSDFCYPSDANIILVGTIFFIYYEDVLYGPLSAPKEEFYG